MKVFETSTRPVLVRLVSGVDVVLKVKENGEGPLALARDFIVTKLASTFGLATFSMDTLKLDPQDARLLNQEFYFKGIHYSTISPGHALCTIYEQGDPWSGDDAMAHRFKNKEDFLRIILFDTWVRNRDRRAPARDQKRPNFGNVWIGFSDSNDFILKAIDHTHCLCEGSSFRHLKNIENVRDAGLFGYFESWRPYLKWGQFSNILQQIEEINKNSNTIGELIRSVPQDWSLSEGDREAIQSFLRDRGRWIVAQFPNAMRSYGLNVSERDEVIL